jgi:hypothetical protein
MSQKKVKSNHTFRVLLRFLVLLLLLFVAIAIILYSLTLIQTMIN